MDLPDPLGPMIACVSPLLIVSVTPLRISLGPSSVSTVTLQVLDLELAHCGVTPFRVVVVST